MKRTLGVFLGLAAAVSFSASAAVVKIESVNIANNFNNTDFAAYWSSITPSTTINVTDLSQNFFAGNANNNTMYKLTADFDSLNGLVVDFSAGLDAGYGAEAFVNGVNVFDTNANIWWRQNWNNAAVIKLDDVTFTAGPNTIELYWAENGNSGGNRFMIEETPLSAVDASAPGALALMGLGITGLFARRKKQ